VRGIEERTDAVSKDRRIEVILRGNVSGVGRIGDVIRVRPGHARNYLLPHGLALPLTEDNKKKIEVEKVAWEARESARKATLEELGKRVESVSVTIEAAATDEGHLFGSVTAAQIAASLSGVVGETIETDHVLLEEPIKQVGTHEVAIRLHPEVQVQTKVWVVTPDGTAGRPETSEPAKESSDSAKEDAEA